MSRTKINFLFLNAGHFYDHFFVLVFATVSATVLIRDWNLGYADLIPYATPGFVAFGVFSIPAGWLADRWSREGMMAIFFIGIGASAILTSFANTPVQISIGLFAIGMFAAIYHPVALALVVEGRTSTGVPLAINGVFGNLGVACAAIITGALIDLIDWRMAYILPGLICIATGLGYALFLFKYPRVVSAPEKAAPATAPQSAASQGTERRHAVRILAIIFTTTAIGGLIFQSTSFAMPKIIDERMSEFATNATLIGTYAFIVFAFASVAQLVVGYMLDNHSLRSIFIIVAASQVILFTLMRNMTGIAALLVAIGYMLVIFGQLPVNDVLVGRVASPAWRSRVYAIRYMVTFSVMATAVPFIAWIHAGWGFSRLFTILAFAAAGIFCLVLLLPGRASVMRAQEIPAE